MRKVLFILFLLLVVSVGIGMLARAKVQRDLTAPVLYPTQAVTPTPTNSPVNASESSALFVPYWTVSESMLPDNYASYIYFGITPGAAGIDSTEQGSTSLTTFLQDVPEGKQTYVTVRMIDSENNFAILKDQARQEWLIKETIAVAKEHDFDGIVLDLEVSAVPFESLVNQITAFTTRFSQEVKKEQLRFSVTIYGDVFYRIRPFAVKEIAKQSDEVMIMAYDFSKARGNPGPNFPLKGKEVYGYDMTEMVADFREAVTAQKLTVIFGMYGYDWEVDDKGNSVSQGKALTYNEIKQQFLGTCSFSDCNIRRKNDSAETEVQYVDRDGKKHVVWFEDPTSVAKKKEFLKQRGITSFGFWANGYF